MKRVLSAFVCVALLCLAAPAVAGPTEAMDKLDQANRALLKKPGARYALLSDKEIKSLIPLYKILFKEMFSKKMFDAELTDAQAALLIGQMTLHLALREEGIIKE